MKLKSYKSCIKYLFDLERVGIKYDLNNIRKLLKSSGNPEKRFKSIHIAGTNGKGSVASVINSVLIESGFNTGLYTSPHINDFRERILINGKMIPKKYVVDYTNKHYEIIEKIKPSFFEVSTAMSFLYFAENDVDIAVIETGLGGRLDSTNVIKPIVSVITGIAIDHTEYLGDSIESIAFEKAGIIKKKIPCVAGFMNKRAVNIIKEKCRAEKSELIYAEDLWEIKILNESEECTKMRVKRKENSELINIELPLPGKYQIHNLKTVFSTLDKAGEMTGVTFSEENIISGISNLIMNSKFFGRFQKVKENPKIVIDVSHNVQGIRNIRENLKSFNYRNLFVIFGMMKDKEYKKCLNELEKIDAKIILTKPNYKRAEEPENLFRKVKNKEKFFISGNAGAAYNYLIKNTGKKDMILVTGSFYLVSDFVKFAAINL